MTSPLNIDDELHLLSQRIQDVHEYVDAHIGQSWGQANPQWPHGTPVFPFREIHTLSRQSINSSFPVTFTVDYDEFIAKLHSAKLRVTFSNVRSNVSAASGAAGGGATATSTSGGSATPTSSSGGGETPTSSSGGSATPTSSSTNSITLGSDTSDVDLTTSAPSTASTGLQSASHTHNETGSVTGTDNSNHDHSLNSHTHTISGHRLNGNGANWWQPDGEGDIEDAGHTHTVTISGHTHTVTTSNHTHTVTISGHTHDVTLSNHSHSITLTYGIFEQAFSNPGMSISINGVDRTGALGGPWNASPGVLDITPYLRETSGEPIRGANTIVFTVASSLLDIEAVLKSVALPSNLLVAGL